MSDTDDLDYRETFGEREDLDRDDADDLDGYSFDATIEDDDAADPSGEDEEDPYCPVNGADTTPTSCDTPLPPGVPRIASYGHGHLLHGTAGEPTLGTDGQPVPRGHGDRPGAKSMTQIDIERRAR